MPLSNERNLYTSGLAYVEHVLGHDSRRMNEINWEEPAGLIALMRLPRVGPATALAIARGQRDLVELPGAGDLLALHDRALEQVGALEEAGVAVLGFFGDGFPGRLREIPSPPAVIYIRGDHAAFRGPALAVAGTRHPSTFGQTATRRLTLSAARRGIVIVSGLAFGIDAIAHDTALEGGSRTVAVLGSGIDLITPRRHQTLAERVLSSGGALVSEQPPGTAPSARTLVARNRLQVAFADALLVGQTGLIGGTMHTVRFAAEQRRPVWCPVPHSPSDKSAGLLALLETPANALPSVVPAWRGHERLATELGSAPLARPVTADSVAAWLDGLMQPPTQSSAQLSLDVG